MSLEQKIKHLSHHKLFKNRANYGTATLANIYSDFRVIHIRSYKINRKKVVKRNSEDIKPCEDRIQILQTLRQSELKKFYKITND